MYGVCCMHHGPYRTDEAACPLPADGETDAWDSPSRCCRWFVIFAGVFRVVAGLIEHHHDLFFRFVNTIKHKNCLDTKMINVMIIIGLFIKNINNQNVRPSFSYVYITGHVPQLDANDNDIKCNIVCICLICCFCILKSKQSNVVSSNAFKMGSPFRTSKSFLQN